MLSNSQKEHLTYTLVWQVVIIAAAIIFIFQYVVPGFDAVKKLSVSAQWAIDTYTNMKSNGLDMSGLQKALDGKPEHSELVKIIQSSDPEGAKNIIRKGSGVTIDYSDWLSSEIWKTKEEEEILNQEKAKLNSIIPTMSPISNNKAQASISLKQYVLFIEKTLLKEFNFDSNVIIGLQGMTFGEKKNGAPETIGMFDFRLDFRATNSDIIKFIDYINTAGDPKILSYTGSLPKSQIPTAMSNPLITMESFSLQERLDPTNPAKENSGRATLKFYIRGVSKDELGFLGEYIKTLQTRIEARITERIKSCEANGVFCNIKSLSDFQKKYQEYIRSSNVLKTQGGNSDDIYRLSQSLTTLQSLEQELEAIGNLENK
jgi:hypothetical protein